MSTSEYFIYLLSCWLNDEKPRGSEDTNWQEIYALAEAHNVTAVITSQIKNCRREAVPKANFFLLLTSASATPFRIMKSKCVP